MATITFFYCTQHSLQLDASLLPFFFGTPRSMMGDLSLPKSFSWGLREGTWRKLQVIMSSPTRSYFNFLSGHINCFCLPHERPRTTTFFSSFFWHFTFSSLFGMTDLCLGIKFYLLSFLTLLRLLDLFLQEIKISLVAIPSTFCWLPWNRPCYLSSVPRGFWSAQLLSSARPFSRLPASPKMPWHCSPNDSKASTPF